MTKSRGDQQTIRVLLNDLEFDLFNSLGRRRQAASVEETMHFLLAESERRREAKDDLESRRVQTSAVDVNGQTDLLTFADRKLLEGYSPHVFTDDMRSGKRTRRVKCLIGDYEAKALQNAMKDFGADSADTVRRLIFAQEEEAFQAFTRNKAISDAKAKALETIMASVGGGPEPAAPVASKEPRTGTWQGSEWWRLNCVTKPDGAVKGCYTERFTTDRTTCMYCGSLSVRPSMEARPARKYEGAALQALPQGKVELSGTHWRTSCGHESQPNVTPFTTCRACKIVSRKPE